MEGLVNVAFIPAAGAKWCSGGSPEFLWQFSRAGTVDFACLVPGHYEAGMRGWSMVNK